MTCLVSFSKTLQWELDKWQAMSGEDPLHWKSVICPRWLTTHTLYHL